MKSTLIKGLLLAAFVIFMVRGGFRLFLAWRVIVPLLIAILAYAAVRMLLKRSKARDVGAGENIISICPSCQKPVGSCRVCRIK